MKQYILAIVVLINLNLDAKASRDPIQGDLLEEAAATGNFQDAINPYTYVGGDPINYTDPNGLWAYGSPSSWFDGNGYQPGAIENDIGEASQATLDGIIPFGDPFKNDGGYDPCDKSLQFSQSAGEFSRNLYTGRLLLGGVARLGASRWAGTRWINSNRYLRLGESGHPPQLTLRIGQARPPTPWNHIPIE